MIALKTEEDIKVLREGGKLLATILEQIIQEARAGVTTWQLETLARDLIAKTGGRSAFLNFRPAGLKPFPAALCVSINEEIVHGVPSKDRQLQDGDVVGLDIGLVYKNRFTDMAKSLIIGSSKKYEKLLTTVENSLLAGIKATHPGNYLGDIGLAISEVIVQNGFSVVEGLGGHGVGFAVHEEPLVANTGKAKQGLEIKAGMVLAIEPMASCGSGRIKMVDDFTFATTDGSISGHFEHTIVVTGSGPEIITKIN